MKPVLGIASYGWPLAIVIFLLAAIVAFWVGWLIPGGLLVILGGYILYFFRDPERRSPCIPNSICSPADGKVASVVEVPCDRMPEGKAHRIAIFLNIFNVHVQRAALEGTVIDVETRPGKCMNALNEKCSEENEAVTVWMKTDFGIIGIRQISGAIARRIVCRAESGQHLEQGARYGIIQFGSRVELFLPMHCTVKVQPGQVVTGGLTCVALAWEDAVKRGKTQEELERVTESGVKVGSAN